MKLKTTDYLFIGAFLAVAALIYVFFFTDVLGRLAGETPNSTVQNVSANGFENFNAKVEQKEISEFENKEEAYQAEEQERIAEEERQAELARQKAMKGSEQFNKVNDLSELMNETKGKKETSLSPTPKATQTTQTNVVTVSPKPKTTQIVKEQPAQPTATPEKRRRRTSGPSFGDQESPATATGSDIPSAPGIIHGTQTVSQTGRVLVRITEELNIPGCAKLDANTMLTGSASIENNRMSIKITTSCDDGTNIKLVVIDPTDNINGLYIESPSDDAQTKKEVAADVVTQGAQNLGAPLIGRTLQRATSRKLTSDKVTLESGRKLIIQVTK